MFPDPRIEALRGLGLTEYQARAYTALVRLGRATATQLARAAGVPRNKLYHTLEELNALGLAEMRLGEVQTFAPLPIQSLVESRLQLHEDAMKQLGTQRASLEDLFQLRAGETAAGAVHRVVHGRAAAHVQLERAIEGAQRDLFVIGGPATGAMLLARDLGRALRERAAEGVRVRVLLPFQPNDGVTARQLDALLPGGVRVTDQPLARVTALVADDRLAVQMEEGAGEEVCLVSESAVVAELLAHAGRSLWALAYPVPPPGARFPGPARPALSYADFLPEGAAAFAAARERIDVVMSGRFARVAVRDFLGVAAEASQRGARVRILAHPSRELLDALPALAEAGIEVRTMRVPPAVGYAVFDARAALVAVTTPDFAGEEGGAFGGLVVRDAPTAASMAATFAREWEQHAPMQTAAPGEADPATA
jgi:sugar-specific transcriptional regulator TrmB